MKWREFATEEPRPGDITWYTIDADKAYRAAIIAVVGYRHGNEKVTVGIPAHLKAAAKALSEWEYEPNGAAVATDIAEMGTALDVIDPVTRQQRAEWLEVARLWMTAAIKAEHADRGLGLHIVKGTDNCWRL